MSIAEGFGSVAELQAQVRALREELERYKSTESVAYQYWQQRALTAEAALSHAAGQEVVPEPTERMVNAFHAGAQLGMYCPWVVNGLRSAMHCDPRFALAPAVARSEGEG